MYDVVIIGAGIVGGMIARELARYRLNICIVESENDVASGGTRANSAIVHAGFDAEPGSLKAQMNVRGAALFEGICNELGVKYRRCGALVLALQDRQTEQLRILLERGRKNGVAGLRYLSGNEAKEIEPALSENVCAALWAPTSAITCPYELAIEAVGNAMDNGVHLKTNFSVLKIERAECGYRLHGKCETVEGKYIVNAAGIYADEIARMAGDPSFSIHPRRGEYLLMDSEVGGAVSHTLFRVPTDMGKGILVTPTVDGNLLAGPTSENIEGKTDRKTTAQGLARIMQETAEGVPHMPFGSVIASFTGLRAVPDGGDFIVREAQTAKNFIHAAGIESPGLSSAPAIAERVAEILTALGAPMAVNEKFNPHREPKRRFAAMTAEEKNEVIRRDPRYGRIVCRCEGVSEGEIVRAIHANPPARDLDAVKRRTRSGMGRCQGGFCTPFVTEILARELGISMLEVTKFGGGSFLNTGRTK